MSAPNTLLTLAALLVALCSCSTKPPVYRVAGIELSDTYFRVSDFRRGFGNIELVMPDGEVLEGTIHAPNANVVRAMIGAPSESNKKPWWAPLGDDTGKIIVHFGERRDTGRKGRCHLDLETPDIAGAGRARCYFVDGTWFAFEFPTSSVEDVTEIDWTEYDMRRDLHQQNAAYSQWSNNKFATSQQEVLAGVERIDDRDGYSVDEAVLIGQHLLLDRQDVFDVWHPSVALISGKIWKITFVAKKEAARLTYVPGSQRAIFSFEFPQLKFNSKRSNRGEEIYFTVDEARRWTKTYMQRG